MGIIRFEARDLKPYGEYVEPSDLIEGETYFAVHFIDDQMLVPELDPLVFIGIASLLNRRASWPPSLSLGH